MKVQCSIETTEGDFKLPIFHPVRRIAASQDSMDFNFTEEQRCVARSRARDPRSRGHARTPEGRSSSGREMVQHRSCGRSSPRRTCSDSRIPEDLWGMGFGIVELCVLLQEVGRSVAPDPSAADPGARWFAHRPVYGTDRAAGALAARYRDPARCVLSAALVDADSGDDIRAKSRHARSSRWVGWRLDGHQALRIQRPDLASASFVPAVQTTMGIALFLLDPSAPTASHSEWRQDLDPRAIFELAVACPASTTMVC